MVTGVDGYHTSVDSIVPWHLSNMWFNCKKLITNMNFIVSHIFREENQCADSLANIWSIHSWFGCLGFNWHFTLNRLGMPSVKICLLSRVLV
jgi:hypothetical protein